MQSLGRRSCLCLLLVTAVMASPSYGQRFGKFRLREPAFLQSFRPVVENAHRSVVRLERFDERDGVWVDAALGAVVRSDGYVISKSSELFGTLRCTSALYRNLDAEVVSRDARYDVALVHVSAPQKADAKPFEPIVWSDQSTAVGRWVITSGIDRMPAAVGVVSVAERTIPPSHEPPFLGIVMDQTVTGSPKIESLSRNGAADRAGLKPGDVIRKINGKIIANSGSLKYSIQKHHPGDEVDVTVVRDENEFDVRVTLQHIPPMTKDPDDLWNDERIRSRWSMMNELGSRLSIRRDNFPKAIQHDTVLNPEDCGGVALNLKGDAVGLNIARSGRTESLMLPASLVQSLVAQMLQDGAKQMTSADGPATQP